MGKLKFLLTRNLKPLVKYSLISFNVIINEVDGRDNKSDISIGSSNNVDINIVNDLDEAYSKKDIAEMKKLLFGDKLSNDIELYVNEAVIGIRSDGIRLKALYNTGKDLLEIRYDYVGDTSNKYEKLIKKLEIAGIHPDIGFYDYGFICYDLNNLGYLDTMDCVALDVWGGKITNKSFSHVYISSVDLRGWNNISIDCLVNSLIEDSRVCNIAINHVISSYFIGIYNNVLKFGNIRYSVLDSIFHSHIDIDNAYRVSINDVRDSVIRIKCSITRDTLNVGMLHLKDKSKLIFIKEVDVAIIQKIIKTSAKGIGSKFSIVLNSYEYRKCVDVISTEYKGYIVDGGENP